MKYAVVEIAGRQYIVEPEKEILVNFLGDLKSLECNKVLLLADGKELKVGTPYLKEKLLFDVSGTKKNKIRVATYKAKANTRKVIGAKTLYSVLKLTKSVKKT